MVEAERRSLLRSTVTRCRTLLEDSLAEVLHGRFGIHADGTIEDEAKMTYLSDEERRSRVVILAHERHIESCGKSPSVAVSQLIREMAFTHLNRFCALKILETRGMIRESLARGMSSNGFKFYLAEHSEGLRLWNEGEQYLAYQRYIRFLWDQFEKEMPALFASNDPANEVFPPQHSLDELIGILNDAALQSIWDQDDTIGWIYQYFTPSELRDQARKASHAPRDSYELAFRNQFYTPRYVVRFLVDNTLGRIWCEMMAGQTRLSETCEYMVDRGLDGSVLYHTRRQKKDPRDIRIIDPACGSGHFLLYCFDLLEVVYEEAWHDPEAAPYSGTDRTLRDDYTDMDEFIRALPGLILSHNLYGIDIDLRATQIAALALWLRAQKVFQKVGVDRDSRPQIIRSNIVVAEPMPGEEDFLSEFLSDVDEKVVGQLAERVFTNMRLAGEAGSLLEIEKDMREDIDKAKNEWKWIKRKPTLFPIRPSDEDAERSLFDVSGIAEESFWQQLEDTLVSTLRAYASKATNGREFSRKLFADDAEKGFAFLNVCRQSFDVVLMNPPFGEASVNSKSYVKKHYKRSAHDLACAFVDRWLTKLTPGGKLGAITTRTPFFLSSSTAWREEVVLKGGALSAFADLGYGVLDAMVETAACVLSRPDGDLSHSATFIRLLEDADKGAALFQAIADSDDARRFVVEPSSFALVPNSPMCYWVSDRIRSLFAELPAFEGDGRTVKVGLQTSDDFRFVRAWWEVPRDSEGRSREDTLRGKRWVPFAKGGAYSPYYADVHLVVNWEDDGEEIRGFGPAVVRNPAFYFRPGLTWPRRTNGLSFRILPAGCVFADKGPAVFCTDHGSDLMSYCANMNSGAFHLLVSVQLARTELAQSYEVGLIQRTPWPQTLSGVCRDLALGSYLVRRQRDTSEETSHAFILPALLQVPGSSLSERIVAWHDKQVAADEELARNQAQIDELAFSAYGIEDEDRRSILDACSLSSGAGESVTEDDDSDDDEESDPVEEDGATHIHRLLSWCLGVVFGRFDVMLATGARSWPELGDPFDPLPIYSPGMLTDVPLDYPVKPDWDGILVDDEGHQEDIVRSVREVLSVIWPEESERIEDEMCQILGVKQLREYFRRPGKDGFFDTHVKRYSRSRRKAPIYWLLQSSKRNYGVWIYYHSYDNDTLFKALETYVRPRIQRQLNLLDELRSTKAESGEGAESRRIDRQIESEEQLLSELEEFRETLTRVAQIGLSPDLNDGVILNIAPLWELVPWKDPKRYYNELLVGRYEWSAISQQLRQKGLVADGSRN